MLDYDSAKFWIKGSEFMERNSITGFVSCLASIDVISSSLASSRNVLHLELES